MASPGIEDPVAFVDMPEGRNKQATESRNVPPGVADIVYGILCARGHVPGEKGLNGYRILTYGDGREISVMLSEDGNTIHIPPRDAGCKRTFPLWVALDEAKAIQSQIAAMTKDAAPAGTSSMLSAAEAIKAYDSVENGGKITKVQYSVQDNIRRYIVYDKEAKKVAYMADVSEAGEVGRICVDMDAPAFSSALAKYPDLQDELFALAKSNYKPTDNLMTFEASVARQPVSRQAADFFLNAISGANAPGMGTGAGYVKRLGDGTIGAVVTLSSTGSPVVLLAPEGSDPKSLSPLWAALREAKRASPQGEISTVTAQPAVPKLAAPKPVASGTLFGISVPRKLTDWAAWVASGGENTEALAPVRVKTR